MDAKDSTCVRILDLKDIIFNMLHGWRKIIITALIFALLIGGLQSVKILGYYKGRDEVNSTYELELKNYENDKALINSEIVVINDNIPKYEDYIENSIYMQIDPLEEEAAYINFYISTDYQIMPALNYQNTDTTDMVVQSYLAFAQNGDMYQYIQEHLQSKIEQKYLKEIVTSYADFSTHMVYLKILHYNQEQCAEIYQLVLDYFNQIDENVTKIIGEHTITLIDATTVQSQVDLATKDAQIVKKQVLIDYQAKLLEKQTALKTIVAPVNNVISVNRVISSTIKYAILGFVLGAMLAAFIIFITNLTSDKLTDVKIFRGRYNIKMLGSIKQMVKKRRFGFIDGWLNKLEGISSAIIEEDEQIKIICAKIRAALSFEKMDSNKILLTGSIDYAKINDVCSKLNKELSNSQIEIQSGANIRYNSTTVDCLQQCEMVVIIEEINHSRYEEISEQLINIADLDKSVIGAILLD